MNEYQQEQLEALRLVREGFSRLGGPDLIHLELKVNEYIQFRQAVDNFLKRHFSNYCTHACFQSHTSACCSKDGIITFFADTVIDAMHATSQGLDRLELALKRTNRGHHCIYLATDGCLWTIRPVVCAMFLCERAMDSVFVDRPWVSETWKALRQQEKRFTWPDRAVLFDFIEQLFMDLGYRSTLMHLHTSPGLLRVKKLSGLI